LFGHKDVRHITSTFAKSASRLRKAANRYKKMKDVSTLRLYLLRAAYLLLTVGTAFTIWPQLINASPEMSLWRGVGCSMLAAMSLLAALGIRYPLAMLPVLFFELIWKSIWFLAIALPLWSAGQMDAAHISTAKDCMVAIIIPFVIPWPYVWRQYVKKQGDSNT
jgi:hypothetical protein